MKRRQRGQTDNGNSGETWWKVRQETDATVTMKLRRRHQGGSKEAQPVEATEATNTRNEEGDESKRAQRQMSSGKGGGGAGRRCCWESGERGVGVSVFGVW